MADSTALASLFANEICADNLYWEMGTLLVECTLVAIIVAICLRMLATKSKHLSTESMQFLHVSHIFFCLSTIVCCLLYLTNHIIYCLTPNYSTLSDIFWIIAIISFILYWGSVLFALFFRLYYIFSPTIFAISPCFICLFFTLFFAALLAALLCTVYFDFMAQNQAYALLASGALLAIVVVFHLLLCFEFSYKLLQYTQSIERHDSSNQLKPEFEKSDKQQIQDNGRVYESKTVMMIRKYTILTLLSSLGAIGLFASFLVCVAVREIENIFDNILMIFYILNVFINVNCISLSLQANHEVYVKYCECLDTPCRALCNHIANRSTRWSSLQSEQVSSSDDEEREDEI